MENNLRNRAGKSGLPPAYEKQPETPAIPDPTQRHVPALVCPGCGRGMTPRVERWCPDGSAACVCALTGCKFNYRPATVRIKG